jgi:hypothetical protein
LELEGRHWVDNRFHYFLQLHVRNICQQIFML